MKRDPRRTASESPILAEAPGLRGAGVPPASPSGVSADAPPPAPPPPPVPPPPPPPRPPPPPPPPPPTPPPPPPPPARFRRRAAQAVLRAARDPRLLNAGRDPLDRAAALNHVGQSLFPDIWTPIGTPPPQPIPPHDQTPQ